MPGPHDHAFLLRCGYAHSELLAMSIEEIVWRVDREAAYEKAVADAAQKG